MSAWGPGIFENDEAQDWIISNLEPIIKKALKDKDEGVVLLASYIVTKILFTKETRNSAYIALNAILSDKEYWEQWKYKEDTTYQKRLINNMIKEIEGLPEML